MAPARHRPGAGAPRAPLSRLAAGAVLALAAASGSLHAETPARERTSVPDAVGTAAVATAPVVAATVATPALAAADPGPRASASAGHDAVQAIDARRSSAGFLVTVRMRGPAEGRIPGVSGALHGSAATGWRVDVRLDAKGLRFAGPQWMERATRSPAFLAVDRYPSIRFASARFDDALLHSGGVLAGELTLRGQQHPVAFTLLPPGCARPGRDCDIRVEGAVSRRAFGMTAHRAMVLDRVDLHIRVRLRGTPP
jgi:polyisoprenoid-binding protein YceI